MEYIEYIYIYPIVLMIKHIWMIKHDYAKTIG